MLDRHRDILKPVEEGWMGSLAVDELELDVADRRGEIHPLGKLGSGHFQGLSSFADNNNGKINFIIVYLIRKFKFFLSRPVQNRLLYRGKALFPLGLV